MRKNTLFILLPLLIPLACSTDPGALNDDAPVSVIDTGAADDYLGVMSREFDLTTEIRITLEGEDALLGPDERLERARVLGSAEMGAISKAVDQKIWDEWENDDRRADNSILLRQLSDTLDGLREVTENEYVFDYLVEVAGPTKLLERFPFDVENGSPYLEVSVETASEPKTYRLLVTDSESTPDSYPEYLEMFEGGLDIAIHIGDDHATGTDSEGCGDGSCNGEESCSSCPQDCESCDMNQVRSLFDALVDPNGLNFSSPVQSLEELALDSGPFVRNLNFEDQQVEVRVRLYHADMVDDDHLDLLLQTFQQSAASADIVVYSGHAGRSLDYSGVVLHYGPRVSVPAAEFQNLDLPDKYQIFVFSGCETYTGYSDSLLQHPRKTPLNADIITTANFKSNGTIAAAEIAMLEGLLVEDSGLWFPLSWRSMLFYMNMRDIQTYGRNNWWGMFGVHGLEDNPRISPVAQSLGVNETVERGGIVGRTCAGHSECPGIDNRCIRLNNGNIQCGVACAHSTGCPGEGQCVPIQSPIEHTLLNQCVPPTP